MSLNILFYGKDFPELNSGYSKITRELLPRIMAKSDHKFSLCCSVGMEQMYSEWKGLKVYPGISDKTTCEDVLPAWMADCEKRFPGMKSLLWIWMDYWPYNQLFNNPIIKKTLWYPPFDYYPFGERVQNLSKCLGVIGMCNWSKEILEKECQLKNVIGWIGHGVDEKIYHPFGSSKSEILKKYTTVRKSLGVNEEEFLISAVFNNQTRKNISQIFEGISVFRQQNPSVKLRLYVHSQHSVSNSYDLQALAKFYNIEDIMNVPNPTDYFCSNYSEEDMARIFNVSDLTIGGLSDEGWGMVNTDSMACCTPTLGLDSMVTREIMKPFLPELLVPVSTYYTFPPANLRKGLPDPNDVAKSIEYVYNKGREYWFERLYKAKLWEAFSWNGVADKWIQALDMAEELLERNCVNMPKPDISKEVKNYE